MGKRTERGRLFRKNLAIVLFISSVPMALIAFSTYLISSKQIEREVDYTHQLRLIQTADQLKEQFGQVEIIVSQYAQQDLFQNQLNHESYQDNFRLAQNMFELLTRLNSADRMIKRVQMYDKRDDTLISPDEGARAIVNRQDRDKYAALLDSGEGFYWKFGVTSNPDAPLTSMTLIHKLPVIATDPYGAFIIDLDPEEMNSLLRVLNPENSGAAFILDDQMDWIANGAASASPLAAALRDEMAKGKNAGASSFRFDWDGQTYAVGQYELPKVGLKFITATPLSLLSRPTILLSRLMIVASFAGLVIAFLLSWVATNQLYRPINRLVGLFRSKRIGSGSHDSRDELAFIEKQWQHLTYESREFQERFENSLPALRNAFLIQFVDGQYYVMSEQEIRKRMESYGWKVESRSFSFTTIELFDLPGQENGFSGGDDKQPITFAAANIVEELLRSRAQDVSVVNIQGMSLGIFLAFEGVGNKEQLKVKLIQLSEEIIHYLYTMLKVNVTIGVGKLTDQLKSIPDLYAQARKAHRFRDLDAVNQIIDLDGWTEIDYDGFTYPMTAEKEVLQALRTSDTGETMRLIESFIAELHANSTQEFYVLQGMQQLLGSIHYTLIQSGCNLHEIYGVGNLYEELTGLRNSSDVLSWCRSRLIEPYMRWVAETQGMKLKQLVEQVIMVIHREYMTDITLESCADLQGTYMKKLSLGFKQVTGMNFIDYLTKVRLDKAKELLRETDSKIHDIAEQVGYQPSYFTRIFKKYEGKTPGQYRGALGQS
ncbi:helix-turn-helix domain-containing protein [Paenibacillus sp. MWE-103]|uniref:Helix-turn-helix domain-containing protein n=1 Tax=Paenibacillus artemisiicola TaxID=1172618 RepID=A0ABS3WFA2_9BACL|nr:helix-turn-helix domain-containing protein [Paenibacillus artemisiicola]